MHVRPAWAQLLSVSAALASLVVGAGPAGADPQREAEVSKTREAREHYDKGIARYNLGDFDPAIAEFKAAYELTRAPRLLFNIAQAQRLKKDWEQAFYFYSTYLRLSPDAPNRADVENRIREMSRLMQEAAAKPPRPVETARPPETPSPPEPPSPVEPPPGVEPPPAAVPAPAAAAVTPLPSPPPARSPRSRSGLRIAGYTVGVAGLLLVSSAVYLSVVAADAADRLNGLGRTGGAWDARNRALFQDGERAGTAAIALYAVGGAALATGVVLTVLGHRRVPATLSLVPTAGGAFVGLAAELP